MKTITSIALLSLVALINGQKSDVETVTSGNNKFAVAWYKELSSREGNLLFSPLSAHAVLSAAYQGAGGSTKEAFAKVLNLPNAQSAAQGYNEVLNSLNGVTPVSVTVANKVFVKQGHKFKPEFENALKDHFHSEAEALDFAKNDEAAKEINSWVEEKTEHKITNLIDAADLNTDTHLVLTNAIYFKGPWDRVFDKESTHNAEFQVDKDTQVQILMMYTVGRFNFKVDNELGAKVIELPFANKEFSMIIILPLEKDGIKALEEKLSQTDPKAVTENMNVAGVRVFLPKFKIEEVIDLEDSLTQLGLGELFDAANCDLSGVFDDGEQLYASKVIQKAYIDVNEEGCEAAAATGLLAQSRSLTLNEFNADHPFMFSLVHKKNNVGTFLFIGRVMNPLGD